MKVFNLKDTSFPHIEFSVPGIISDKMRWDRSCSHDEEPTFCTHEQIFEHDFRTKINYALLIESQAIMSSYYVRLLHEQKWAAKYDLIFTHSSDLLNKYDNARWIPGNGIWSGGDYGGGEIKLYPKSKLCSMISSDKKMCPLHNTRIAIAEYLAANNKRIDMYGTLFGKWTKIIDTLQDYMFSIVIENYIDELYFTEKLLNCFATGTVPIYMGAKNIGKVFNTNGILQFNKSADLFDILLDSVNSSFYESRMPAITENFELCKKYRLIEDFLIEEYRL